MLFKNRKSYVLNFAVILALLGVMFGVVPARASAVIRYVKWNASGANNGTSWTNAYTNLQSALSAVSSGDEVWVAAGTYKPTTGIDRTISFTLKSEVAVYGGFAGTETLLTQRNPVINVAVLNGDIGVQNNTSDNSYHVVVGSNTNNSAILDGFTITRGNSNNPSSGTAHKGGGMYNMNGNPSLTNLIFTNNSAVWGGGIANDDQSSPILTNVTFSGNTTQSETAYPPSGGGMFNTNSSPSLVNVTFHDNSAEYGGGLFNHVSSSPTLMNVTFSSNSADYGGGMLNRDPDSSPTLTHVTMSSNIASIEGGAIANAGNPVIRNSILWGNTGGEVLNINSGATVVAYSIVQGGYPGTGNLDADSLLGPLADNGGYTQTMALGAASPAIDAGTNTGCPATDQRGVTRPQGLLCDIGAYEYELTIADVDVSITGNNVGNYAVAPEKSIFDRYGINGGPVRVSSTTTPIFASERVIYRSSFNSIVGYPANQLTTDYWFTSYDDVGMITYLVIGNPHPTDTALVDVYIGGVKRNGIPYSIAPGQRIYPRYGINAGPVHVVSTNNVNIFTSERTKLGESFNEVMGYPGNQLTTDYWFTSYDDVGMITYLVIGNPHLTDTAQVDVYIGGVKKNNTPYLIAPGQRIFPRFATNAGPVHVVSANNVDIFTSERSKFKQSFNEVMGYPGDQVTTDYWFTSYDDASMITYLVIGNPHTTLNAEVDVYIDGVKKNNTPYIIAPGQRVFPRYAINAGPVHVVSTNGVAVFTSERSKYLNSFNEILGIANNRLTTDYWFTSYDDAGMDTELVIAAPAAPAAP